jgi:hypothetical protein
MTGAKFFFVRGCSFVLSYLGILFLLANGGSSANAGNKEELRFAGSFWTISCF